MISDSDRSEGRAPFVTPLDRAARVARIATVYILLNAVLSASHGPRLADGRDCPCVLHEAARNACLDEGLASERADPVLDVPLDATGESR